MPVAVTPAKPGAHYFVFDLKGKGGYQASRLCEWHTGEPCPNGQPTRMTTHRQGVAFVGCRALSLASQLSVPHLIVLIDTEEEFDWSKPFDRSAVGVEHVEELYRVQNIMETEKITPAYLLDYPIAANQKSADYFRKLASDGRAEIGAQLHPWVTPPHDEVVNDFNSHPGNLPAALERDKIRLLCDTIEANVGVKPKTYKAGRYGIAHQSFAALSEFGFTVDTSSMPGFDLRHEGGPDYSGYPAYAYATGDTGQIIEMPTTGGFIGVLRRYGPQLYRLNTSQFGRAMRLEAILSRLNINARIRLSPEGYSLHELQALTRTLHKQGNRLFTLNFHSPSIAVGHTGYAQTIAARDALLHTIQNYLCWFRDELGGAFTTPQVLAEQWRPDVLSGIITH